MTVTPTAGMPYNYVGGAEGTVSFEQAPAVAMARDYMKERLHAALDGTLEEGFPEFNEVLSAAYMESQSMAFHCDSEAGLGPVVAGLSLGAPAAMEFREKRKSKLKHEDGRSEKMLNKQDGTILSILLNHVGRTVIYSSPHSTPVGRHSGHGRQWSPRFL